MGRQRFSVETIVRKLREAEVDLSRGQSVAQIIKKLGVCEQTYYRWRKEYGGLRLDQAKRLKSRRAESESAKSGGVVPPMEYLIHFF
jgi:putative transposase